MEIFKLISFLFRKLCLRYIRTHGRFFNISSPGDLRRRFAKFVAKISQRHNEYESLSMFCCLKTCFTWMACFWNAAIGYSIEEIQIDLNGVR